MKSFQPFRLDEANQCLWKGNARVTLMPKPFAVLRYLVENAGRLITHEELLNAIWPDTYVQPEVLRRYILEIRRVLGDKAEKPHYIETLPKRGYQFIAVVTEGVTTSSYPSTTGKLVGRTAALANLDKCFEKAVRGERQVVFLSGEAGIGKTSLVDTFQQRVETNTNIRVTRGQSVEGFGGKEAYYPIFEALGRLANACGSEVITALVRSAPTWIIQFPSLVPTEQHAALQRETLGATRERMVRELCEALEVITQTTTLVILLEDLHWVDHSTVDLISAIARRREPAKLFVLGTYRPADLILYDSPFKTLKEDLLLHHLSHEVQLERLNESDVAEYLATEFASDDLPLELATLIHRHSDGNPLFMTAILDHLTQKGVLSETEGRWKLTTSLEQVDPGVPETLRQMLELQMRHLTDEERRLLKCASVAGEHFTAWSIATMMASDPSAIEEQCSALAEKEQFLKAVGLRELSNGELTFEYEFRHALYREVLYRNLNPTQRVNFHRLLAQGLERLRTEAEPEAAAEIALHFEEGREYEGAVWYLIVTADKATRNYAHREAIQALERARELVPKLSGVSRDEIYVQILEKLGDAYYALGDMERSAATYHVMATQAAEAGLLTAQANALMRLAHSAEAIPFFLKAVELDPKFASAYVSLSRIYSNLGEVERAREYARRAYEQVDHVSERERLSIEYQYSYEVTGNQSDAATTLETWKQSFPEEFQPANCLAFMYNVLGDFKHAVDEGKEALRRNPSHGFPYSNLAHSYRGLGDFNEAKKTAEKAVALNIETLPTRRLLYQLAIMSGDLPAAAEHVEWGRDKPREFEIVAARAQVAGCSGKLQEARRLYEQTAQMAGTRNLADVGTNHLSAATWMEMAFGNTAEALAGARRVLDRNPSYDPCLRVALTLSMCGYCDEAEAIVVQLQEQHPEHTIINFVLAPIVRAGIALARKQPDKAVEHLEVVAPYELGFAAVLAPIYLRAQSYLMLGLGVEAMWQFQHLLDHRGSEPFSPFYSVASLGLARAEATNVNLAASLQAYKQFINKWADADEDVPVLTEARAEYDDLKSRMNPQKKVHAVRSLKK